MICNVPVEANVAPVAVNHEIVADHHVMVTVPSIASISAEGGSALVIFIVYVLVVVSSSAVTVDSSTHVLPAVSSVNDVVPVIVANALFAIGVEVIVPIYEYNICNM
jgi:hypothetical protein